MTECSCPELERLFEAVLAGEGDELEHARTCPDCSLVLAEHQQLERELYRISDPLPPPDLVRNVMAEVARAPAPHRHEVATGLFILVAASGLALALLLSNEGALAQLGTTLAGLLAHARAFLTQGASGLLVAWEAAGTPAILLTTFVFLFSLLGLKRLAGGPVPQEA